MKITYILFVFLLCSGVKIAEAQISVRHTNLVFELPNKKWSLYSKGANKIGSISIYKGKPIKIVSGKYVTPKLTIVTEVISDTILLEEYSQQKLQETPFKVINSFTSKDQDTKISLQNAIGYQGTFYRDDLLNSLYVIHLISNKRGIQIFLDIPESLFKKYDKEFIKALESLALINVEETTVITP